MTAFAVPAPASLGRHLSRTVELAVPIIMARAALVVMFTVDTVMAGRAGAEQLAFFGLGVAPQLTLMLIAVGALQATAVLVAQAAGAGAPERAGAVLRTAVLHALGLGLAVLLLSQLAVALFLAIGHPPELAAGAGTVSVMFGLGLPGTLLFIACNLFMEATGRPKTGMVIMLVANMLNIPLNGVLGLGWGDLVAPMGAEGVMLASSILRTGAGVFIAALLIWQARRRDGYRILSADAGVSMLAEALAGEPARQLRRLGLPMGLAQGAESAAFATVVMMAGLIGTVELAAYQTVMTLVTLAFMMAIGTGGATAIRVGRAVGEGHRENARRAGLAGIALGALWPVPVSVAFLLVPDRVAALVTEDPATIAAAAAALHVAAFMMSADAAMAVTIGALRGLGDVWWPMAQQICAFWLVGIPIAWAGGIYLQLGAGGLIGGLLAGVFVSLAGLLWRFARRVGARDLSSGRFG